MREEIIKKLRELEKDKDIQILFAVESGSRAWGLASKDSDYDVRFVYKKPLREYLMVNPLGEVLKRSYDKDMNEVEAKGCEVDMVGFDIMKFTKLLSASNPTAIEWLNSDIYYINKPNEVFRDYGLNQFNKISLYYHYKSMCKQNYLKYLKTGLLVTHKKYLYAMRGLVNSKFVAHYDKVPFIKFEDTLKMLYETTESLPNHIYEILKEIIRVKKTSNEQDKVENEDKIDKYIEEYIMDDSDAPTVKKPKILTKLNEEIYQQICGDQE